MDKREENVEVELLAMLKVLFRKFWIIFLAAVLAGGSFFAYTVCCIEPLYTADTMLYVNNKSVSVGDNKVSISQGDLTAAQSLVETYGVILKSRSTIGEVIQESKVPYTYEELVKMISSEAVNGTEIFHIEVTSPSPEEAEILANTIAKVLPEKIAAIVDGSSVRIIDDAIVPPHKSSPSIAFNTFLGILIGGFIASAWIVIRELCDDQIRDTDYITANFQTPILAVVPDLRGSRGEERYGYEAAGSRKKQSHKGKKKKVSPIKSRDRDILGNHVSFAAAEAYKLLRTNLEFSTMDEEKCQIIGVTSYARGEGKTTTSINTAYTFAQTGKKVLLIEADLRLPNIAHRLNLELTPGLSNLLSHRHSSQGAIQPSGMIDNLWIVVAGDRPPNPAEMLGSMNMKRLLEALSVNFDVIIVDLPPVGIVSDALTVSKYLDGVVVVAREKLCTKKGLAEVLKKIRFVNARILGLVVTGSEIENKNYRHGKYGGKYGYQYGYEEPQLSGERAGK